MYHNDSSKRLTYKFDVGADGKPANRRVFLQFGETDGYPDGMTVDSEGCLWIAFWDGWSVKRYSPSGQWLETVRLPVQNVTSCTFGGPDLDLLYITSATLDLDENALQMQPNAGGLFMLAPGVKGLSDLPYAG
jgi:sugar lactone lactonase YvrE